MSSSVPLFIISFCILKISSTFLILFKKKIKWCNDRLCSLRTQWILYASFSFSLKLSGSRQARYAPCNMLVCESRMLYYVWSMHVIRRLDFGFFFLLVQKKTVFLCVILEILFNSSRVECTVYSLYVYIGIENIMLTLLVLLHLSIRYIIYLGKERVASIHMFNACV